jgi:hypothetical protein
VSLQNKSAGPLSGGVTTTVETLQTPLQLLANSLLHHYPIILWPCDSKTEGFAHAAWVQNNTLNHVLIRNTFLFFIQNKNGQRIWTRIEESPAQSKVRGIAAKTSLDQLFVQYKCTVMDDINGHYLQLPLFSLQGFPLYEAQQIGRATTGEPTLLE